MIDAAERLVNLALFLASRRGRVTAEDIRREVTGYPEGQDDVAFKRMLERDKDALRSSGFVIESDDEGNYWLDSEGTFIGPVELSDEEAATLSAVAMALADDPSFPFAQDLRLARIKICSDMEAGPYARAALADEHPAAQGRNVAVLASASAAAKRAQFDYTNASGVGAKHEVEPYGLFLHGGRWYLVARDVSKDEIRTYAVTRMGVVTANAVAPKTPDFQRPDDFDVSDFIRLPFQYGPREEEFEAVISAPREHAARLRRLAARGAVSEDDDGSVRWTVSARSAVAVAAFVAENGPGLRIESPEAAREALRLGLAEVVTLHA